MNNAKKHHYNINNADDCSDDLHYLAITRDLWVDSLGSLYNIYIELDENYDIEWLSFYRIGENESTISYQDTHNITNAEEYIDVIVAAKNWLFFSLKRHM